MLTTYTKAPWPQFGGKRQAAPAVWDALGDVHHYVEPFCGSCAVLLERPHPCNRPYYSESVNDADGHLVNALRAIAYAPQETAEAASYYVSEADTMARHLALLQWAQDGAMARLKADVTYHDATMAGYWLYGICAWIGSGWCSGKGPWRVDHATGRVVRDTGRREPGVQAKLPHLNNNGRGVHRPQLREPGVEAQRPHLTNNGQGVHHAGLREPGVWNQLPHMGDNGKGVHHAGLREPGVAPATPPPEVTANDVEARIAADYEATGGFHPMPMPELRRWFQFLSARLRHVRIVNGDWRRMLTPAVLYTIPVGQKQGYAGVFLDPPYSHAVRDPSIYTHEDATLSAQVRAWCLAHGEDAALRIVLAGFEGEGHEELEAHGWRGVEWFEAGFLRGGMAQQGDSGTQQHRERLWLSPRCRKPEATGTRQMALW